jgi:hypothetical protein
MSEAKRAAHNQQRRLKRARERRNAQARERRRRIGLCPLCGKLIAFIFPMHNCTPATRRKK